MDGGGGPTPSASWRRTSTNRSKVGRVIKVGISCGLHRPRSGHYDSAAGFLRSLVTLLPAPDLLLFAKHLFVAANIVWDEVAKLSFGGFSRSAGQCKPARPSGLLA